MAETSDSHLVLLCNLYDRVRSNSWDLFVLYVCGERNVNLHYDALCIHSQYVCPMLYTGVKGVCCATNTV
jgi:hypothetical protein